MELKKMLVVAIGVVMAMTVGTGTAMADHHGHHGHHGGFHFSIGVGPVCWGRPYYCEPYYVCPPAAVVVERPIVVERPVVVARPVVVYRPAPVVVHRRSVVVVR